MTWQDIVTIEPRLLALETAIEGEAVLARRDPHYCANTRWCLVYKPLLMRLVGWTADKPELRTCEAYDLAYDHLYGRLPDCRNCTCVRLPDLEAGNAGF